MNVRKQQNILKINNETLLRSIATEREFFEKQRYFLSRKLVAQLVKSWATCQVRQETLLRNFKTIARFCCMSGMGLTSCYFALLLKRLTRRVCYTGYVMNMLC